jgi:hypothetical protein
MNNEKDIKDDLLRRYISPEKIEEAPEGFTSKVMFRIGSEIAPVAFKERFWKKNLVPAVSALITLILIILAFLLPEDKSATSLYLLNILTNIELSLPKADFSGLSNINLPSVTIYTIIAIACLTVFDKALSGIFKRR